MMQPFRVTLTYNGRTFKGVDLEVGYDHACRRHWTPKSQGFDLATASAAMDTRTLRAW